MIKQYRKAILCSSMLFISVQASAIYFELNPGYANTGHATINSGGLHLTPDQKQHIGWNVNVGQQFLGIIGAEAGYTQYAKTTWKQDNVDGKSKLYSYHLAAVFQHGFGPIYIQTKIGLGRLNRGNFTVNNVNITDKNHSGLFWGLGAGVHLTSNWYMSLQYQQIQGRDETPTVNLTSVGVGYSFL